MSARCGWVWVIVVALAMTAVSACAAADVPGVTNGDPVLIEGRTIYSKRCVSCHGAAGGGGRGPRLARADLLDVYPTIADQAIVVSDGRQAMPAFKGSLNASEIEAVVRYTREVLATS